MLDGGRVAEKQIRRSQEHGSSRSISRLLVFGYRSAGTAPESTTHAECLAAPRRHQHALPQHHVKAAQLPLPVAVAQTGNLLGDCPVARRSGHGAAGLVVRVEVAVVVLRHRRMNKPQAGEVVDERAEREHSTPLSAAVAHEERASIEVAVDWRSVAFSSCAISAVCHQYVGVVRPP